MLERREVFLGAGAAGLLTLSGATTAKGHGSVREQGHVAASLNELRAASAKKMAMLCKGAIFCWTAGDYSRPPLGPADDINVVKQNDTPLSAGAWVRQFDMLSVKAFGAVEGELASSAANTAAFNRAIAAAAALAFPLHLNGGTYLLDGDGAPSGGVNFARPGLHIKGGGAILRFSGVGKAFVLDTGADHGQFLEGMSVQDITIIGGAGITDGFYSRGIVRSTFRNIAVLDIEGKAFHIKHGVANQYESLNYSAWRGGQPKPAVFATHGIYLDNNDHPSDRKRQGYYTANCTFINSIIENFPGTGCYVSDGSGNLFIGGTFEAVAVGVVTTLSSYNNTFFKVWFEANTEADAVVSGNNNGFLGPWFISDAFSGPNVRITADGKGTWFSGGGYIRYVDMAAGSSGTTFHQIGVDENAGGTIGFQGLGDYTRINCKKIRASNQVVGAYGDVVGPVDSMGISGVWTPFLVPARGRIAQNAGQTHGTYHRIGKLVFAQGFIEVESVSSPAGEVSIRGLPYAPAFRQAGSVYATQLHSPTADSLQVRIEPGSAALLVSRISAGVATGAASDIKAGTTLAVSITYTAQD